MAKRLNKKVAIIGFVVLLAFGGVAIMALLHFSGDPVKFIADGDAAYEQGDLETAKQSYLRARARAKDDEIRAQVLRKLIDIYLQIGEWPETRGCWNELIKADPEDISARYAELKYFYIVVDTGANRLWAQIEPKAVELLEIVEKNGLLLEPTSKWESPLYEKAQMVHEPLLGPDGVERIGPFLYAIIARAKLYAAVSGAVTEPDKTLDEAVETLNEARQVEPNNVNIALYMAQATTARGNLMAAKGRIEQRRESNEQALEIISQVVEAVPNSLIGRINLLLTRQRVEAPTPLTLEWLLSFEPQYLQLIEQFPDQPRAHATLSGYYRNLGPGHIDKAIDAAANAKRLDPQNVNYAAVFSDAVYLRFYINQDKTDLDQAVNALIDAVSLPSAQETAGPYQMRNINNRAAIHIRLANIYIDQLLEPGAIASEAERQQWIDNAAEAVHEIEQIYGSGENPQVVKYRAMLQLAGGEHTAAIKELYSVYQRLEAAEQTDTQLAYTLAKAFQNTTELGAAREFFERALLLRERFSGEPVPGRIDLRRPDALLEYAALLLRLRSASNAIAVISNLYEPSYGPNVKSKVLRTTAMIVAGQYDEAEEYLAEAELDEPNELRLNAYLLQNKISNIKGQIQRQQLATDTTAPAVDDATMPEPMDPEKMNEDLRNNNDALYELLPKLLSVEPNTVSAGVIASLCQDYRTLGQKDKAEKLSRLYLEYFPENITAKVQLALNDEPGEITLERTRELQMQVSSEVTDPSSRVYSTAALHLANGETDLAIKQLRQIIEPYLEMVESPAPDQISPLVGPAANQLLELAIRSEDQQLTDQVVDVAGKLNLDGFNGDLFEAQVALVRGESDRALELANSCLETQPVFSQALLLRSRVNSALEKYEQAIDDARTAAIFNPLNGSVRKALALALYNRDRRLGDNATSDQILETKRALMGALATNRSDVQLLSFYAEYISNDEPKNALALRKELLKISPSPQNAVLLGRLATRIAATEYDSDEKQALMEIAEDAFKRAMQMAPDDRTVIASYSDFLRFRGDTQQAEELLADAQDDELLAAHFYNTGRFDKATETIEKLYEAEPKNVKYVADLLRLARVTRDKDRAQKYGAALVALEDTPANNVFFVKTLLNVGLTDEAERKLAGVQEKFPDEPSVQTVLATLALQKGQLDRAMELVNRALETQETNADPWYLRGHIYRLKANYSRAANDFNKSKSLNDTPVTRLGLARTLIAAERYNEAVLELAPIVENPQTPDEARYMLEYLHGRLGNKTALKAFYATMIEKFGGPRWHYNAAQFYAREGDLGNSEQLLRIAIDKSPSQQQVAPALLDAYLSALIQQGKHAEVVKQAKPFLDSPNAHVALLKIAETKVLLKDSSAAAGLCRQALDKASPDFRSAGVVIRTVASLLGKEEVRRMCADKLAAEPDSVLANYLMFQIANLDDDYNKAMVHIAKVVELAGDTEQSLQYKLRKASIATSAYEKYADGRYLEQAITIFEQLNNEMPDNAAILNNLAYTMAQNNMELPKALEYAQKANDLSPNNSGLLDTYAYVLYKNGRFNEAAENAQSALQLYELEQANAPAAMYEHLGLIREGLKEPDAAVAAYKRALELGENEFSQEKIDELNQAIERLSGD